MHKMTRDEIANLILEMWSETNDQNNALVSRLERVPEDRVADEKWIAGQGASSAFHDLMMEIRKREGA